MNNKNILAFIVILFASAFVLRTGVAVKQGFSHPMESDSYYYIQLAQSLSHGAGYCMKDSFWPDQPTMQRMPGWPFLVSWGLRVCAFLSPDVVMRVMCITLDSLNAVLVGWLTWMLFGAARKSTILLNVGGAVPCRDRPKWVPGMNSRRTECASHIKDTSIFQQVARDNGYYKYLALLAGLIYAAHPAALFLVYNGESEPLFVALCLTGFILLLRGGRWMYLASFCFGLSCLVRANYVIWIGAVVICYLLFVVGGGKRVNGYGLSVIGNTNNQEPITNNDHPPKSKKYGLRSMVLLSLLFLLPSLFWSIRNYHVCGHFPVLSTLRGQTFYGGNNPVVANTMDMWGYWIFPDGISGEKKAAELAKTMSEYDLDVYYYARGKDYVKTEWFSMPRLLLGKFVRAYIPIPWKPNVISYGVGAYRGLIYLLAIAGMCWWRRSQWAVGSGQREGNSGQWAVGSGEGNVSGYSRELRAEEYYFKICFAAMLLTNLAGVLIFWGCFRFAFVLEPLLIPFAAAAGGALWKSRRPRLPGQSS